jgi:hypothetical protein
MLQIATGLNLNKSPLTRHRVKGKRRKQMLPETTIGVLNESPPPARGGEKRDSLAKLNFHVPYAVMFSV